MSHVVERTDEFQRDFALQAEWYLAHAGPAVVRNYEAAVNSTVATLARLGPLGHQRRFRHPDLQGLRSLVVERPFERHVIFYRTYGNTIRVLRLVDGARDLPRRLRQAPGAEDPPVNW